ncbi:M16 family metallopeptidase [Chitinasiproducens palmae]|uniref:Zinc protease n=1 Tax=Chitinasiproducens palmae TaxID=1770053 RepID=A0A1H2PNJ5_9BURK|nr:pitrilysin family protein [Chitinasiproducens palmae]SDV48222.1 zinc protease [Chitinasiproducens palmae]
MSRQHRPLPAAPAVARWHTANGVEVRFVARHEVPIVDVNLDFDAGAVHDPADRAGVAELVRSLLFTAIPRGDTGPALDEEAIEAAFDELGAELSVDVRPSCLSVGLRMLSAAAWREPAIALLGRGLSRPRFGVRVFERERDRLEAWLAEQETETEWVAERAFETGVFGDHPLARTPDADSLQRIALSDLDAFWRSHCGAAGAILTIVGDLSQAAAEDLAARLTVGLPPGAATSVDYRFAPAQATLQRVAHDAAQAHVLVGALTVPATHADAVPLALANRALNWRLHAVVRERDGLAYDVSSTLLASRYGFVRVALKTRADQAEQALGAVLEVMDAYQRDGVDADDFERMRNEMLRGYPLGLDSNAKLLRHVADTGFDGLPPDELARWPARAAAVALDEASRAFAAHLAPARRVSVIVGGR